MFLFAVNDYNSQALPEKRMEKKVFMKTRISCELDKPFLYLKCFNCCNFHLYNRSLELDSVYR